MYLVAGDLAFDDRAALVVAVQLAAQFGAVLREFERDVLQLTVAGRNLSHPDAGEVAAESADAAEETERHEFPHGVDFSLCQQAGQGPGAVGEALHRRAEGVEHRDVEIRQRGCLRCRPDAARRRCGRRRGRQNERQLVRIVADRRR